MKDDPLLKRCRPTPTYTVLLISFCAAILVEGMFILYLINLINLHQGVMGNYVQEHDSDLAQTYHQIEIMSAERENLSASLAQCKSANHPTSIFCNVNSSSKERIVSKDVLINTERIVITLDHASISSVEATGSMLPTFNENSHLIQIVPTDPKDIAVGDIVAFEVPSTSSLTVHRVVALGTDEKGWFATTKGDHINVNDPKPVRFGAIRYVVVGILY